MKSHSRLRFFLALAFAFGFFLSAASLSHAAIIASEDFDGYTFFPDFPADPANLGVPLVSEGADSGQWMGARIGGLGNGAVSSDVGVQMGGHPTQNMTPVGRAADDVGLVMKLDLTAYENVVLDFDWRMHNEENLDRFRMAYFQGNEYLGNELGSPNGTYDWFNDPNFGNGSMTWYTNEWTELVTGFGNVGVVDPFVPASVGILGGDIIYLLFWLDNAGGNGNFDLGKIDNVVVTGDLIIPEPGTCALLALGITSLASLGIRRRSN